MANFKAADLQRLFLFQAYFYLSVFLEVAQSSIQMENKYRHYLTLLMVSIAVRVFFYFFPFEAVFHGPKYLPNLFYNVIFFGVLIRLLNLLKDRKWIIILTWFTLTGTILYDILTCIGRESPYFTVRQFDRCQVVIGGLVMIFYLCIFLTRKGPARLFFRFMTAAILLPYIYYTCTIIFHIASPGPWMNGRAFITILAIILNLLLAFAVVRASRGRQDEYADFLND